MLITLITVFVLCVAIAMIVIGNKTETGGVISAGLIILIISAFSLLFFGGKIITAHIDEKNDQKRANLEQKAVEMQINQGICFGIDAISFNETVVSSQAGYQDIWTSWFYASYWMDIEPVELPIDVPKYDVSDDVVV